MAVSGLTPAPLAIAPHRQVLPAPSSPRNRTRVPGSSICPSSAPKRFVSSSPLLAKVKSIKHLLHFRTCHPYCGQCQGVLQRLGVCSPQPLESNGLCASPSVPLPLIQGWPGYRSQPHECIFPLRSGHIFFSPAQKNFSHSPDKAPNQKLK